MRGLTCTMMGFEAAAIKALSASRGHAPGVNMARTGLKRKPDSVTWVQFPAPPPIFEGRLIGRTPGFEPDNLGSTPSPQASLWGVMPTGI